MSAFVRVAFATAALAACATDDHVTVQQAALGDTATVALYVDRLSVHSPVTLADARIDLYYGEPPDPTICDGRDRISIEPSGPLELPLEYLGATLLARFAAPAGDLREIRIVFAADAVKAQPCADSDRHVIRLVPDDRTFELAAGATAPVVARLDAAAIDTAFPAELPASIRWWSNDPKDALTGESYMPDGSVPVRRVYDGTPSYATLSPQEVFDQASGHCGGKVVIGLKSPKIARGYFKGHVLLSGAELAAATATAYSVRGVTRPESPPAPIVMRDGNPYPAIVATVGDASAIEALRMQPTVDFVEPGCFQLMGSLACGPTPYTPSSLTVEQDQLGPPVAGGGTGDLIPWAYPWLGVTEAWGREALPGINMTVGVIDTGVHATQQQLHTFFPFQRGFSATHLTVMPTLEDNCGHGTHIAGVLAAPKDGRNVMGIAWASHLVTVRTNDDVIHDIGSQLDLARAIATAVSFGGARVINMSIGSPYGLTIVSDTIKDIFDDTSRPPVIFVAAAGTNIPFVSFPATMNREVIAASTVEVDTSALQSQPPFKKSGGWTVSYGSDVDFVGVQKEGGKGIPTTGTVGDGVTEEIETVGGSSTGAAQVSGVATLAWSRNPLLTRSQVIERMGDTARRNLISGLGNYYGKDKDVGFGIPDAYAAAGGMRHLTIQGPVTALPNTQLTVTAATDAIDDQTFNYVWSGAVAPTSGKHLTITTPASGTVSLSVIATDPTDGHFLTATYTVMVTKTHVRRLDSIEVVDNWSITPFGGKDDTTIFAGTMAAGCSWTALGGQALIGNTRVGAPVATLTHASNGFSVSSHPGSTSRDLVADVHTWWDGFSGIRLDASWTVVEPDGVDCSTAFAK